MVRSSGLDGTADCGISVEAPGAVAAPTTATTSNDTALLMARIATLPSAHLAESSTPLVQTHCTFCAGY
jgi:hypothetical protein